MGRTYSLNNAGGSTSSSTADADMCSDAEKASRPVSLHSVPERDLEKQEEMRRHHEEEIGNGVPIPGMTSIGDDGLEESDETDGVERDEEHRGQDGGQPVHKGEEHGVMSVVDRVLSRASAKSFNPGPPPDGGFQAWTAAACAHLVIMNTWGFINSFGVFQSYYVTLLKRPPSDIAWIGSFQVFLLFFIGTFTGRLTDAGYFRALFVVGTVLQMVGIFTTALATQYWHFFLAQGVVLGIGNGCLFCPALAVLSTYFSRRRSFAIGIAACGSATGGLVFPSVVRQLLPRVGFAWSLRVIGFVQLVTMIISNVFLKPRIPPRRSGRIVDWAAFREAEYVFYAAGSFFCFWGVYFAFFYIAAFSRDIIGLSYEDSLNLLLVINGVGAVGRIVPNHLADRLGAINMFVIFAAAAGVVALCWTAVRDTTGLYVWSVFYGVAAGGIQSLFPAGLTSLTSDLKKAGVRMGMVFTINSFATLTGPPIAGAIISAQGGSYKGAQGFAGSVLLIGTGFMVAARVAKSKKTGVGLRARV